MVIGFSGCSNKYVRYNAIVNNHTEKFILHACYMEIILAALYDDRSIRAHVHRTRELLSLSTLHASLSTSLALQYETTQNKASSPGGLWY